MSSFFIEMVRSGKGDSYIINIKNKKNIVRILVDGGSEKKENNIDLYQNLKDKIIDTDIPVINKINGIVVTHIDDDHIGGILKLLQDENVNEYIDLSQEFFVIFNDFVDPATISYQQGIRLTQAIENYPNIKLINTYLSNQKLKINGFNIYFKINNNLKSIDEQNTKEDIIINLLLPDKNIVKKLMKNWRERNKDGILINKSSIVFVLQYNSNNILMTGDAYYKDVIDKLNDMEYIDKLDVIKLSHHGADKNNMGIMDIIKGYNCKRVMLLTNETKKHPSSKLMGEISEINDMEIFCPYDIQDINIENKEKIIIYGG